MGQELGSRLSVLSRARLRPMETESVCFSTNCINPRTQLVYLQPDLLRLYPDPRECGHHGRSHCRRGGCGGNYGQQARPGPGNGGSSCSRLACGQQGRLSPWNQAKPVRLMQAIGGAKPQQVESSLGERRQKQGGARKVEDGIRVCNSGWQYLPGQLSG